MYSKIESVDAQNQSLNNQITQKDKQIDSINNTTQNQKNEIKTLEKKYMESKTENDSKKYGENNIPGKIFTFMSSQKKQNDLLGS